MSCNSVAQATAWKTQECVYRGGVRQTIRFIDKQHRYSLVFCMPGDGDANL